MDTSRERHREILGDGRLAGPNTNTGVEAENITGERGDRQNETLASREGNWFLRPVKHDGYVRTMAFLERMGYAVARDPEEGVENIRQRRENVLLQGQLSVLTLISVSVPPQYRSST